MINSIILFIISIILLINNNNFILNFSIPFIGNYIFIKNLIFFSFFIYYYFINILYWNISNSYWKKIIFKFNSNIIF